MGGLAWDATSKHYPLLSSVSFASSQVVLLLLNGAMQTMRPTGRLAQQQ